MTQSSASLADQQQRRLRRLRHLWLTLEGLSAHMHCKSLSTAQQVKYYEDYLAVSRQIRIEADRFRAAESAPARGPKPASS